MWRATIKGVLARKVRLALTALSIVLGVTFVTGTYVLTDTLKQSFGQVFGQLAAGSDVVVRTPAPFGTDTASRARLPASYEAVIRGTDGVQAVEGAVYGTAKLIDKSGKKVVRNGVVSAIGTSWNTTVGPLSIVAGRAPERSAEIVLDAGTARRTGFAIGDAIELVITGAPERFELVGTLALGARADLQSIAYFALEAKTAQREFAAGSSYDWFYVRAEPGTTPARLQANLQRALPNLEVTRSDAFADQLAKPTRVALGYLNDALLGFAAIGLFVGAFIIFNTFTILVQQRTRELALFRALGASGRQIVGSVVTEAFVVGLFAALSGLVLGVQLARYLLYLLPGLGFRVPDSDIVLLGRTVEAAILVGVVVTVASSLMPAVRAARIPPIVGINEVRPVRAVAVTRRTWVGVDGTPDLLPIRGVRVEPLRRRGAVGAVIALLGLGAMGYGLAGEIANVTHAVAVVGVGAFTFFVGVATVGPLFARPLARALGTAPVNVGLSLAGGVLGLGGLFTCGRAVLDGRWPATVVSALVAAGGFVLAFAGPTAFGVLGTLARGNAMRNPRRTSATAFALVIGLTLVCVVATFESSAKASMRAALDKGFRGDFVISAEQFEGFPIEIARRVSRVPAIAASTGLRFNGNGRIGTRKVVFAGVDPTGLDAVVNLDYRSGGTAGVRRGGVALHEETAESLHVGVGDRVEAFVPRSGFRQLIVAGVYRNRQFTGSIPADAIVSTAVFDGGIGGQLEDTFVYAKARPGQMATAEKQLKAALRDFAALVSIDTAAEFRQQQEEAIGTILNVLVALLAFSLLIAVIGIVNTLFLSVYERTRELGLLRAAGMSRRQVRRMIRGESVIVAMIGCVIGIGMGLFWGWVFNRALRSQGLTTFAVPVVQLGIYLVLAAVAGVVAALLPAWRAGRLDVLEAIANE